MEELEKCSKCGQELQIGDWPFCPKRGGPHESSVVRTSFEDLPIVVYRDASGHTIFPGSATERMPKRYAKLGYERVEMRPNEARKFASEMNSSERRKMERQLELRQAMYESAAAERRAELRQAIAKMSPLGRDFAMAAIEQSNREEARKYLSQDPGFHIEILE